MTTKKVGNKIVKINDKIDYAIDYAIDYTMFYFVLDTMNISIFITDTPKDSSIEKFTQFMNERGITDIFCFSEVLYDVEKINSNNTSNRNKINFHHLEMTDGSYPDDSLLNKFNKVIDDIITKTINNNFKRINLLFHCRGGLGRAPVMLAYMMITRLEMNSYDCVESIRKKRKGSINTKQLKWLLNTKFKKITYREGMNRGCIIL